MPVKNKHVLEESLVLNIAHDIKIFFRRLQQKVGGEINMTDKDFFKEPEGTGTQRFPSPDLK